MKGADNLANCEDENDGQNFQQSMKQAEKVFWSKQMHEGAGQRRGLEVGCNDGEGAKK